MQIARQFLNFWICALATLVVTGCGSSEPTADKPKEGGLMPVSSPKEKLDEQRLADATKGLSFKGGVVSVTDSRTPNRSEALVLMRKADKAYNVENVWFESVGNYRDAIIADPSYAPAYIGMAKSVMQEGEASIAEAAYRTAIAKDPTNGLARYELGLIVQGLGDNSGAISIWRELAQKQPSYPDVYVRLAISSHFENDHKSAYAFLAEADKRKQAVPPQFRTILKEAAPRP